MIAEALALFGAVLMLLAAVGVLRFRDALARMHALTKASTLGLLFLLGGTAIGMDDANDVTSLVLAMCLQLLTLPVGSNLIARATYQAVSPSHRVDSVDELEDRNHDG